MKDATELNEQELKEAYELSGKPYVEAGGAVEWHDYIKLRSWRYILEVNSACNIRCVTCHAGQREGFDSTTGMMDPDLMERILDKIVLENPQAIVCAYANSDPMVHPNIAKVVASIRGRGLSCEIATNGNLMRNVEAIFEAKPTLFTVSISGWTQDVYERAHRGGNIETVKKNIVLMNDVRLKMNYQGPVGISYHQYKDNMGEDQYGKVQEFARGLGLMLVTSNGRSITMENTIQELRRLDGVEQSRPYGPMKNGLDLNTALPPTSESYRKGMERVLFHPKDARQLYERWPVSPVCVISDVFTEIRHDGRVQLCPWTDDQRLTMGNFLDMSPQDRARARLGHPFCKECLHYRTNLYFHIIDRPNWGKYPH